jgi:hypothetical protein
VTWLILITAERAVFRSCPLEILVRKAIAPGSGSGKTEGLRRSFARGLQRFEATEYRAGPNVHGVGGAARDRDHRNLPNNQVARQPLKQSPKRSCAAALGASFVPMREDP